MSERDNKMGWKWLSAEAATTVNARSERPDLVRLGTRLRNLYENVVDEPLPDRFTGLLTRLEQHRP
jgi:hypothetical protein